MMHNFGSGPSILPQDVIKLAADSVLDYNGLSILEIGHRSDHFVNIMEEARELMIAALQIPTNYTVLFLQGGASLGFSISALNLMRKKNAAYINTGLWSKKAILEAQKLGIDVDIIASSEDKSFDYIPKIPSQIKEYDYIHYTSNNTIYGTQFQSIPEINSPLVCDMSSDILSRSIDVSKFDLIYAGAQKNIGPAGTTVYIVKNEILGKSTSTSLPSYLDLHLHTDNNGMFNTPPVFSIFVSLLNLRHLMVNGGVAQMEKQNNAKAKLLYQTLDKNELFQSKIVPEHRSIVNATFQLKNTQLTTEFDLLCANEGIIGLKGHRSVGDYRASMYNAMPLSSVQMLSDVINEFQRTKG